MLERTLPIRAHFYTSVICVKDSKPKRSTRINKLIERRITILSTNSTQSRRSITSKLEQNCTIGLRQRSRRSRIDLHTIIRSNTETTRLNWKINTTAKKKRSKCRCICSSRRQIFRICTWRRKHGARCRGKLCRRRMVIKRLKKRGSHIISNRMNNTNTMFKHII